MIRSGHANKQIRIDSHGSGSNDEIIIPINSSLASGTNTPQFV